MRQGPDGWLYVVTDNANYGQLVVNSGNPATDPWVVRSDVKFWWNRADIGGGNNITKGGLQPPGFGSGPGTFGPEFGFGWAVGENSTQPVLLIKTAWGGRERYFLHEREVAVELRPGGCIDVHLGIHAGHHGFLDEGGVEVARVQGDDFHRLGKRRGGGDQGGREWQEDGWDSHGWMTWSFGKITLDAMGISTVKSHEYKGFGNPILKESA